jgi:hypothetical protein
MIAQNLTGGGVRILLLKKAKKKAQWVAPMRLLL